MSIMKIFGYFNTKTSNRMKIILNKCNKTYAIIYQHFGKLLFHVNPIVELFSSMLIQKKVIIRNNSTLILYPIIFKVWVIHEIFFLFNMKMYWNFHHYMFNGVNKCNLAIYIKKYDLKKSVFYVKRYFLLHTHRYMHEEKDVKNIWMYWKCKI